MIHTSALRNEMRKSDLVERYTVLELLQEMDTLVIPSCANSLPEIHH